MSKRASCFGEIFFSVVDKHIKQFTKGLINHLWMVGVRWKRMECVYMCYQRVIMACMHYLMVCAL